MLITAAQRERLARNQMGQGPGAASIVEALDRQCRQTPDKTAIVEGTMRISFGQLRAKAARVAAGLVARGVGAGDVISIQLPNWHEAMVLVIAAEMAGAIINPIVPIYRDAEVAFILSDSHSKMFFLPRSFRSFEYDGMVRRLIEQGHPVPAVVYVRDAGDVPLEESFGEAVALDVAPRSLDEVRLLMYTSGTTGRAKGVLHSGFSLAAEIKAVEDFWHVTGKDVVLMPSPLTHVTGYLYGIQMQMATGCSVVLMDRWVASEAAALIEEHSVTLMVGATPFLAELVSVAEAKQLSLPSLRMFACGGAPVPPDVIYRGHKAFARSAVCRIYGSTEAPTITLGPPNRLNPWQAAETDGVIVGNEVVILDPRTGRILPAGEEGQIAARGPELFLGYLNPKDDEHTFTTDGYFLTGDLGRLAQPGVLVITGRIKDLIIRGGENIAPKEIEDALATHPAIEEAAVVAIPSQRLGEGVGAFIIFRPGAQADAAALKAHVLACGLAIQKCPEQYFFVADVPKTAAGKVKKDLLRKKAVELLAEDCAHA